MKEPSEDVEHSLGGEVVLLGDLLSGIAGRKTLATGQEVVIDNGLVSEFDGMPSGGHAVEVGIPHEVRNVV